MARYARESWRRDPRVGMLVLIGGVLLVGFVVLAVLILLAPGFVAFDISITSAIRSVHFPGSRTLAIVTTTLGSFWPIALLTAVTAGWLYARRRRVGALILVVAVAGGSGIGELLKLLFTRARPTFADALIPSPDSYGFPSGHALSSLIYFGCLALLVLSGDASLRRKIIAVALCTVAAAAVALSRVFLGVHYFGDVVGSWMFGGAWLSLVTLVGLRWGAGKTAQPRQGEPRASGTEQPRPGGSTGPGAGES